MKKAVAVLALASGVIVPAAVAGASSPNASCIAVITHQYGPPGGNIEFIKSISPAPGRLVSQVAHQPKGQCELPPEFFE